MAVTVSIKTPTKLALKQPKNLQEKLQRTQGQSTVKLYHQGARKRGNQALLDHPTLLSPEISHPLQPKPLVPTVLSQE